MVCLNVNTPMALTRFYLAGMRQRQRGGVINLGSTASFQPVSYMAVYGATKAFVLFLSQALAEEVAAEGVTVMALCPGATATGFQSTAGVWEEARATMHTPEQVAEQALCAFERGKLWLVSGFGNRVMAFLSSRLIPRRTVLRLAGRVLDAHRSPTTRTFDDCDS